MNKLIMVMVMFGVGMLFISVDTAEAKRFGGGSSFGKQRSAPSKQPSMSEQKSPASQGTTQRGSARSGMMGMLGGLALGGLLGAMFFGGGFEGINFFDIAIIALIGFAAFIFMRKRAAATSGRREDYAYAGGAGTQPMPDDTASNHEPAHSHDFSHATARPEIDEAHFLPAAKSIFMRMQQASDEQNTTDIEQFCTKDIAKKVIADMKAENVRHETEVGMLDAALIDTWLEADQDWASVHFTAMMKETTVQEDGQATTESSSTVNEIWTFSHDPSGDDPTWYLAGIAQQ